MYLEKELQSAMKYKGRPQMICDFARRLCGVSVLTTTTECCLVVRRVMKVDRQNEGVLKRRTRAGGVSNFFYIF